MFPQADPTGPVGQLILGISVGGGDGVAQAAILARKVDWWVSWTVAMFGAYAISFLASGFVTVYVLSLPGAALVVWAVYGGLAGAIGSFGQWVVLRRHVADASYFMLASVVGFALTYASRDSPTSLGSYRGSHWMTFQGSRSRSMLWPSWSLSWHLPL